MTYLEHITTYVVSLVGRGVTLSSGDLDVVRRWEAAGLPAESACRAIRRQIRRLGPRRHLRLADCTPPGLDLSATEHRAVSQTETSFPASSWTPAALLERLTTVGRAAESDELKTVYRAVYRRVRALPEAPLSPVVLSRLDDLAVRELERGLRPYQRRDARRRARLAARRAAGAAASRESVERLARVLLEEQYCNEHGLTLPSDLLLNRGDDGSEATVHRLRE